MTGLQSPMDTPCTAIYYPWIRVLRRVGQRRPTLPLVGHMAGIYARTDIERGVHKAPANEVLRAGLIFQETT